MEGNISEKNLCSHFFGFSPFNQIKPILYNFLGKPRHLKSKSRLSWKGVLYVHNQNFGTFEHLMYMCIGGLFNQLGYTRNWWHELRFFAINYEFQECKDEELERYKKEVLQLRQQFEQLR